MLNKALVVAYEWPGYGSGSEIALRSSLLEYASHFDQIRFLGCGKLAATPEVADQFKNVEFVRLETKKLANHYRFLKSLLSKRPAITDEFRHGKFLGEVGKIFESSHAEGFRHVIFESLTPTVIIDHLPTRDFKIALRSFDVMQLAFEGVGSGLSKLLWDWESRKVATFENDITSKVSAKWAISHQDLDDYKRCGTTFDGVLGVSIDTERYADIPDGDNLVATHLGSTDPRKRRGLWTLAKQIWPVVREEVPNAQLVLGGRGTEDYTDPDSGIVGCGFVEDDREFLGRGKITINSQIGGSGVKLKSLNALAANRLLVSTEDGIRGIQGTHGKHYLAGNNDQEMIKNLVTALQSDNHDLRKAGRAHIETEFSQTRLHETSHKLINDFIHG